eukprot:TRINITY_DN871_c0_g2_i2.p1 TRINITY_DN871_c0_g2~~TRINITY_DN871_c0_g2_i2.p1  ORF type:complete len:279 (+),score=67.87 TRINITY_DN871_c0_g2_i2:104-940(+)
MHEHSTRDYLINSAIFYVPNVSIFGAIMVCALVLGISYYILKNTPRFNLHLEMEPIYGASRCVSLVHGLWTTYYTLPEVWGLSLSDAYRMLNAVNTDRQNRIIRFSCGYFIFDLFFMIFVERDIVFILHHILALTLWGSSLSYGRAAVQAMVGLFWGEVTNPLQSLFWLAKRTNNESMVQFLSPIFTWGFLFCRVLALPYYAFATSFYLVTTSEPMVVPFAWRAVWAFLFCAAMFGSWLWAYALVKGYMKMKQKLASPKEEETDALVLEPLTPATKQV